MATTKKAKTAAKDDSNEVDLSNPATKPVEDRKEVSSPAPSESALAAPGDTPELTLEEVPMARLTVYHPMAQYDLDDVQAGDLVLDKETVIGTAANVLVLGLRRGWKEKIDFDDAGDEDPQIAWTAEERDALIADIGAKNVIPFCDLVLLVERPDTAPSESFPYEFEGRDFCIAKFSTQKKQNVTETFGRVQAAKFQHNLRDVMFRLSTKPRKFQSYRWHAPTMALLKDEKPAKGCHELLNTLFQG